MNTVRTSSNARVRSTLPVVASWLALLLTLGFAVLLGAALAGVRAGSAILHPNPFAAYESLWVGQSSASVSRYGQRTREGHLSCLAFWLPRGNYPGLAVTIQRPAFPSNDRRITCWHLPQDGVFDTVTVILEDEEVQTLELFSKVLSQDALFLYWGVPDAITWGEDRQNVVFRWNRSTYTVQALVREADAMVTQVTLTTTGEKR